MQSKLIIMKTLNFLVIVGLFLIQCVFSLSLNAQNMLLVRQYGKLKNAKFFVGSYIDFKYFDRAGEVRRASGIINVINEETIIINYTEEYEIEDIKTIFVSRKLLVTAEEIAIIAGGGFLALTGINNLISKENNKLTPTSLSIAGSSVALGFATIPLNKKRFHLHKKDKFMWEVLIP